MPFSFDYYWEAVILPEIKKELWSEQDWFKTWLKLARGE
jgi:hypothetical protein